MTASPQTTSTHTALPRLGEDPAAYHQLLHALHEQIRPRNLMETQYLELFADAAWKMRRLSRLEAQAWEDGALDEDARLTKIERLARLQAALRRQMDRAVRMLARDVAGLFARRTREDVLAGLGLTESQCAENPYRAQDVERAEQAARHWLAPGPAAAPDSAAPPPNTPPAADATPGEDHQPEARENRKCQNEPAPAPSHPLPQGEVGRLADPEGFPPSPRAPRRREWQALEDLVNGGTLPPDECLSLLMSEDIPGFHLESGGRIKIHR